MEFELLRAPPERQHIDRYGPGSFLVSGVRFSGSILVFAERCTPWPVRGMGEVDAAALEPILRAEPAIDLLLLGTGATFRPPPAAVREALRRAGIALEPMPTAAACRTFNLLLAEERRVAAALIALPGAS